MSWLESGDLEDRLRDHSRKVGNVLLQALAKKYAFQIEEAQAVNEGPSPPRTASDLSLTVTTVVWALECGESSSWCDAVYRGRLVLKDNRTKSVLSAGDCQSAAQGHIVLARDRASILVAIPRIQESLRDAAAECADRFRRELFGLYGS